MNTSVYIAVASLAISAISLTLSLIAFLRDQYRLTASARTPTGPIGLESVIVHVVNSGRRPITLRYLVFVLRDGTRCERSLGDKSSLRLMENEDHEFALSLLNNGDLQRCVTTGLIDARIEDSHGRKWPVEDLLEIVRRNVGKLTTPIEPSNQ